MAFENEENNNKRRRERYVTCSEETLEEMEKYVDKKFDDNSKNMENINSEKSGHQNKNYKSGTNHTTNKRGGRPTIKTSKKQLLMKIHENRSKTYGFVQRVRPKSTANEKSPPSKAKKIVNIQAEECSKDNASEDERSPPAKAKRYENREMDNVFSENINVEEENQAKADKGSEEVLVNFENDNELEGSTEDKNEVERNEANEVEILDDDNDQHVEGNTSNKRCIDCDKFYCDYQNKKGKKKCRICKCSEHGCIKEVLHNTSKGDTWLCGECLNLTNLVEKKHPDLFENLRKAVMRNTQSMKTKSNHNKTLVSKETEEMQNNKIVSSRTPISLLDIVFKDEDLQSLNEGEWISDSIIAFWLKYLEEILYKENQNILFIPPSVTQVLKAGFIDDFGMILEPLNIWQKKYIIMAVNDNKLDKAGGQHWSLLVYTIKENVWYHYDSLNNFNLGEARFLVGRLQEYIRPGAIPNITAASCTQQDNTYDCGAYTMICAEKLADILASEAHSVRAINPCYVKKEDTKTLRNKVRKLITTKEIASKDKRENNDKEVTKQSNRKHSKETINVVKENGQTKIEAKAICPKDSKDPKKFPNINKDKICVFLTKGNCRYGAKGENNLGKCNRYHPDQCRNYNLNGTMENGCKKGDKCEKWHPTYFCHLSINSKICHRVDCHFKHHRNCTVAKSDNFLATKRENMQPHSHSGPKNPMYNKWQHHQPYHSQHPQHQTYHQQYHQRYHQMGNNFNQPRHTNQSPQIPYDQLKQVIQSVILEMNSTY